MPESCNMFSLFVRSLAEHVSPEVLLTNGEACRMVAGLSAGEKGGASASDTDDGESGVTPIGRIVCPEAQRCNERTAALLVLEAWKASSGQRVRNAVANVTGEQLLRARQGGALEGAEADEARRVFAALGRAAVEAAFASGLWQLFELVPITPESDLCMEVCRAYRRVHLSDGDIYRPTLEQAMQTVFESQGIHERILHIAHENYRLGVGGLCSSLAVYACMLTAIVAGPNFLELVASAYGGWQRHALGPVAARPPADKPTIQLTLELAEDGSLRMGGGS